MTSPTPSRLALGLSGLLDFVLRTFHTHIYMYIYTNIFIDGPFQVELDIEELQPRVGLGGQVSFGDISYILYLGGQFW